MEIEAWPAVTDESAARTMNTGKRNPLVCRAAIYESSQQQKRGAGLEKAASAILLNHVVSLTEPKWSTSTPHRIRPSSTLVRKGDDITDATSIGAVVIASFTYSNALSHDSSHFCIPYRFFVKFGSGVARLLKSLINVLKNCRKPIKLLISVTLYGRGHDFKTSTFDGLTS